MCREAPGTQAHSLVACRSARTAGWMPGAVSPPPVWHCPIGTVRARAGGNTPDAFGRRRSGPRLSLGTDGGSKDESVEGYIGFGVGVGESPHCWL